MDLWQAAFRSTTSLPRALLCFKHVELVLGKALLRSLLARTGSVVALSIGRTKHSAIAPGAAASTAATAAVVVAAGIGVSVAGALGTSGKPAGRHVSAGFGLRDSHQTKDLGWYDDAGSFTWLA